MVYFILAKQRKDTSWLLLKHFEDQQLLCVSSRTVLKFVHTFTFTFFVIFATSRLLYTQTMLLGYLSIVGSTGVKHACTYNFYHGVKKNIVL